MASRRVGQMLGPYRLIEQIGRGGMATVYRAYDHRFERDVALKILPAHYAEDARFTKRFAREARTIAKLEHPNILPVHDFGEEDDTTYLVMRYVEGGTLKEVMGQGRLTLTDIADLMDALCAALEYAHRKGVIHRDVKPANVIIDNEGWPYLSDFGIAKVLEGAGDLTETGAAVGTPAYMAPEQGYGKEVDARTDIYALGIILYEMVVGKVPFQADTPMATVLKHMHEPLPLPREDNPGVPEPVERVILKALAKEPEHRYESATALATALRASLEEVEFDDSDKTLPVLLGKARRATEVERTALRPAPAPETRLESAPRRPRRWLALTLGGAVVVLFALGGVVIAMQAGLFGGGEVAPAEIASPEVATAEEAEATLYDAFEDPAFDGGVNSNFWTAIPGQPPCETIQQDGQMVITNTPSEREVSCGMRIRRPVTVTGGELETLEARMRLSADHNGPFIGSVLRHSTDFGNGTWGADCGILADEGAVNVVFFVYDSRRSGASERLAEVAYPIDYETWYTIRLQTEPETMTVSCLVDGEEIGSYTAENVSELHAAQFWRELGNWRVVDAQATIYVDDFRVIRPAGTQE